MQFLGDLFADRSAPDAVDPSSCRPNRSPSALASFWLRLAAPRADLAVIDSTAKIGEPLVVLLRPSTIFAASVLEV